MLQRAFATFEALYPLNVCFEQIEKLRIDAYHESMPLNVFVYNKKKNIYLIKRNIYLICTYFNSLIKVFLFSMLECFQVVYYKCYFLT